MNYYRTQWWGEILHGKVEVANILTQFNCTYHDRKWKDTRVHRWHSMSAPSFHCSTKWNVDVWRALSWKKEKKNRQEIWSGDCCIHMLTGFNIIVSDYYFFFALNHHHHHRWMNPFHFNRWCCEWHLTPNAILWNIHLCVQLKIYTYNMFCHIIYLCMFCFKQVGIYLGDFFIFFVLLIYSAIITYLQFFFHAFCAKELPLFASANFRFSLRSSERSDTPST